MKPAVLCLLLLSACELEAARNYRVYRLTWTCLSPEGCERTEQMALLDRAKNIHRSAFVWFESTRDFDFVSVGQLVPSDALPAECFWLYGFVLFGFEMEPSRFCRTAGRIEMNLSIPNQDPATNSTWLVEGRETDP
jgi:hypothetical protein